MRNWRLLVCGSRTFSNYDFLSRSLDRAVKLRGMEPILVYGAARGADMLAGWWAMSHGYTTEPYFADWKQYGKRAGYLRNKQMLDEGKPESVIAFVDKPLQESRGTAMMVKLATTAGIATTVYRFHDSEGGEVRSPVVSCNQADENVAPLTLWDAWD